MTPIELHLLTNPSWQALAGTLAGGFLLGLLYFVSLWTSTQRILHSRRPVLWMVGGFLLRMAVVLPGFYWLGGAQWQKLLTCMAGFIIARLIVITVTARLARPAAQWEDEHAS